MMGFAGHSMLMNRYLMMYNDLRAVHVIIWWFHLTFTFFIVSAGTTKEAFGCRRTKERSY